VIATALFARGVVGRRRAAETIRSGAVTPAIIQRVSSSLPAAVTAAAAAAPLGGASTAVLLHRNQFPPPPAFLRRIARLGGVTPRRGRGRGVRIRSTTRSRGSTGVRGRRLGGEAGGERSQGEGFGGGIRSGVRGGLGDAGGGGLCLLIFLVYGEGDGVLSLEMFLVVVVDVVVGGVDDGTISDEILFVIDVVIIVSIDTMLLS